MPRPVLYALLAAYLVALALIGYWPTTVDKGLEYQIWSVVGWCSWNGCEFISYPLIERLANVALFVPFGLLLAGLLPRGHRAWGIAIAVMVSVAIEVGQLLFLPGRYPSASDIITNSLGGTIGVVIVLVLGMRRSARRDRELVAAANDSRYRGE